jgi:hypothetical protein
MNGQVRALTVYEGELIAGGDFTLASGAPCNRVARWDGSAWQPLGSGTDGRVEALCVYNGELIAGGQFMTASGETCHGIARWDGGVWPAACLRGRVTSPVTTLPAGTAVRGNL